MRPSTDTARLARAATLQVRPLGNGRFTVSGGTAEHKVAFPSYSPGPCMNFAAWCDCGDFAAHLGTQACKHIIAVALTLANDEDRAAIAALLGIG